MNCDWEMIPLGDLITLQRGHDLPASKRKDGVIPIMGSSGITGYHNEAKCVGAGVIVGRSGNSMGEVSFIDEDHWPLNTCLYVTDFKGNDPKYIYYLLKIVNFDQFNSGSAQKSLNRNAVYPFEVYATKNKTIQKNIGRTLSQLESKESLNTKTNQTLEEMAQTIFKSWFVDFEPVKTKMSGKQPEGIDEATTSFFPDNLVESKLGLIPEGWRLGTVKELCQLVQNGGTPKRSESGYWTDGTINWFTTGELSDSPLLESKEKISQLGLAESAVKLWPKGTILIAIYAAPTVGRLGILSQEAGSNQACTGLVPKSNFIGHYLFNSLYFARDWLNNISVGAAQQNISKGIVESLEIIIPSEKIVEIFGNYMEIIWQKRLQLQKESQCLANLREYLLPKLLSGEINLD